MATDNITAFPGRGDLPENPIMLEPRRALDYCQHPAITIDEHARTVRCADVKCGAMLDPFDFLRGNARVLQRAWDSYRMVMQQANEVAGRVSVLKREEQNLRARVKRLQSTPGLVINTRGEG